MNARFCLGILAALIASSFSVNAGDTPSQAAARAALEQKMNGLDNPQTRPSPGTPSATETIQSVEPATNATAKVSSKMVTPQTTAEASNPAVVPVADTPLTPTPAAATQPAAAPTDVPPAALTPTPMPNPVPAQTKSSTPPLKANPTNEIVTTDGTIYENVLVEKVEADGIIISYALPSGGMAMSRISFSELSPQARQQYEGK